MWEDRVCNQFFVWLEASVVFWVLVWCVGILRCLWWRVPMSFECVEVCWDWLVRCQSIMNYSSQVCWRQWICKSCSCRKRKKMTNSTDVSDMKMTRLDTDLIWSEKDMSESKMKPRLRAEELIGMISLLRDKLVRSENLSTNVHAHSMNSPRTGGRRQRTVRWWGGPNLPGPSSSCHMRQTRWRREQMWWGIQHRLLGRRWCHSTRLSFLASHSESRWLVTALELSK